MPEFNIESNSFQAIPWTIKNMSCCTVDFFSKKSLQHDVPKSISDWPKQVLQVKLLQKGDYFKVTKYLRSNEKSENEQHVYLTCMCNTRNYRDEEKVTKPVQLLLKQHNKVTFFMSLQILLN